MARVAAVKPQVHCIGALDKHQSFSYNCAVLSGMIVQQMEDHNLSADWNCNTCGDLFCLVGANQSTLWAFCLWRIVSPWPLSHGLWLAWACLSFWCSGADDLGHHALSFVFGWAGPLSTGNGTRWSITAGSDCRSMRALPSGNDPLALRFKLMTFSASLVPMLGGLNPGGVGDCIWSRRCRCQFYLSIGANLHEVTSKRPSRESLVQLQVVANLALVFCDHVLHQQVHIIRNKLFSWLLSRNFTGTCGAPMGFEIHWCVISQHASNIVIRSMGAL